MRLGLALLVALAMLLLLLVFREKGSADEKTEARAARALVQGGRALGCFFIAAQIAGECVRPEGASWAWTAIFGAAAFIAYFAAGEFGLRSLLGRKLGPEMKRGNVAAATVAAAHYVSTGWVTAHAFAGYDARGLGLSFFFFALAIVTLQVGIVIFRGITVYDDASQVESGNVAAAVSYAGLAVAMAIVVGYALDGDVGSIPESLVGYAKALVFALIVWPVRQIIVQTLLLGHAPRIRGGAVDTAVAADRNVGVAALEAAAYVGAAYLCANAA